MQARLIITRWEKVKRMKEIRLTEIRAEQPAGDNNALILQGVPIVYDTPTTINDLFGSYTEIIKRGALDSTDLSDVRLMLNHDTTKVPLARTPKTMHLEVTPAGLTFRAELPDTESAKEVYTAVQRGDISGMSFAFKVPEGGDEYDPDTNTRTITKIEKVMECSVVNFPAYPTTSVEARQVIQGAEQRQAIISACNSILVKGF